MAYCSADENKSCTINKQGACAKPKDLQCVQQENRQCECDNECKGSKKCCDIHCGGSKCKGKTCKTLYNFMVYLYTHINMTDKRYYI